VRWNLKNIRDYIAEDNEEYATKTIKEILFASLNNFQKLAKPSKWCATRQVDILNKGLRTT
jgi:hypothetical protein